MKQSVDIDEVRRIRKEHLAKMEAQLAQQASAVQPETVEPEPRPSPPAVTKTAAPEDLVGDDFLGEDDAPTGNPLFEEVDLDAEDEEEASDPAPTATKEDVTMSADLDAMTRPEIIILAKTRFGLDLHRDTKKADAIAAVRAAASKVEAGT